MELQEKILDVLRGTHVAALATVGERGAPAVRHMMLTGFDDLMIVGGARADSDTVAQLRRTPYASIAIWSEKEFTDPYVQMQVLGGVHEDRETKMKYWSPTWERYFGSVENPEFVVLVFRPDLVEYLRPESPCLARGLAAALETDGTARVRLFALSAVPACTAVLKEVLKDLNSSHRTRIPQRMGIRAFHIRVFQQLAAQRATQ